jgi:hypothetical protein
LVSFELKDFSDKKETMSSANSEKQLVTRYVKNNKQMFHTSHIPGQVNLSPPKTETLYKKVSIDQNTGSDLIVEDLEFCDYIFYKTLAVVHAYFLTSRPMSHFE